MRHGRPQCAVVGVGAAVGAASAAVGAVAVAALTASFSSGAAFSSSAEGRPHLEHFGLFHDLSDQQGELAILRCAGILDPLPESIAQVRDSAVSYVGDQVILVVTWR